MKRLLHERFAEQARRTPEAVALRHRERVLTCGALEADAVRIAGALIARDVAPGSVVGLHLERSLEQVAAVLGILKSGAAVLPLPPAFPAARQRQILDCASPALVIDSDLTGLSSGRSGRNVLPVESLLSEASSVAVDPPSLDEEAIAFVLSSSGSTGRPKLIARSHRSFFHRLEWTWRRHPYHEGEVCCQKAHMTTTHSIYELFEPLLMGVENLIVPDDEVRDLERFWEVLREKDVTRLLIVPSPLRASLAMPGFEPPPMEVVIIMGEYVSPHLADEVLRRFPASTRIYSIYGSTEASSTLVCDLRALFREGEELPLGTPISEDTRAMVLDGELRPVGTGGTGRLYLGGPALFSGYLGDPASTEEAFVSEPGTGERLYDTRDQVELTFESELRYIGRVDHTVKVRGFRVNTGEVENVVREHPTVASTVVLPEVDPGGATSLVAFVTPSSIDPTALFDTLRTSLPDYMVPSAIVPLDSFPMTASAKIDRVRLLEERDRRRRTGPEQVGVGSEDLTGAQRIVWQVWARTLEHEAFDLDSSWFEVGGSSLTVFALVHRLREAAGLDRSRLNEQTVYRRPTIRELAVWIEDPSPSDQEDGNEQPLLVTLRSAAGSKAGARTREPLFVVASAGGTLGAYARLAAALDTDREVLGVRDPMIWGGREGNEGFRSWVDRYLEAIEQRQPEGPYFICAYSSAGAFGFEIARRLRERGEEVALLALVEPLALDRGDLRRFGHWALRATWMRPSFREMVRAAGWMRVPFVRLRESLRRDLPQNDHRFPAPEYEALARELTSKREHLVNLSRLMELNSGMPFTLDEEAVPDPGSADWMELLKERVHAVSPEVDLDNIERIAVQYQIQVRTHHAYRLSRYDGEVLLVEPRSRYSGILAALLRPYIRRLTSRQIALGEPSDRVRELTSSFGGLTAHYRCMRDDRFVAELAELLEPRLR
ncbi:MAG: AMP-binding protein [marine benthic group bacterium]|nr:AMP-binding protein [Gemmatimonadota bacterium]MCL7986146.1 AMP-binding protein [Gemmatimonadota bacterium]